MKQIKIFTDGSFNPKTKTGALAYLIINSEDEIIKEHSEIIENTSQHRMELKAVIFALDTLDEPCCVKLYSDSGLIVKAFNDGLMGNWADRDWKTNAGNDRANKDLWFLLLEIIEKHNIEWIKIKSHSGNYYNSKVDKLARKTLRRYLN